MLYRGRLNLTLRFPLFPVATKKKARSLSASALYFSADKADLVAEAYFLSA